MSTLILVVTIAALPAHAQLVADGATNTAAIQELKRRDAENAELKRSVEGLKTLVNALAQKLNGEQR